MPLFDLALLAIVQGVTEFLPISSSGHLVLLHRFLDNSLTLQQERMLDIAVHVGTLFSVLLYFRRDVVGLIAGAFAFLLHPKAATKQNGETRRLLLLVLASLPVMVVGAGLELAEPCWLGSMPIIALCLIGFGILLYVADRFSRTDRTIESMSVRDALIVGCAQALALIPGVSRAGITMTAARFCGYGRAEAARFSLLLATIAIAMAGTFSAIKLAQAGDFSLVHEAAIATTLSFATGYIVISLMMKWLQSYSYTPFVLYRVALGFFLLFILYGPVDKIPEAFTAFRQPSCAVSTTAVSP